jgi:hypothetical protein
MNKIKAQCITTTSCGTKYITEALRFKKNTHQTTINKINRIKSKAVKHIADKRNKTINKTKEQAYSDAYQQVIKGLLEYEKFNINKIKELEDKISAQVTQIVERIIQQELINNQDITISRVKTALTQIDQNEIITILLPKDLVNCELGMLPKCIKFDESISIGNFKIALNNGKAIADWKKEIEYLKDVE